jgi:hypothetical protein
MKHTIRICLLATGGSLAALGGAQNNIQVIVDGTPVVFHGQGPQMSGDRVLVPLRGVLEQMGATVNWNPSSQTVTARKSHVDVRLTIGQTTASVDSQPVQMDVPAQIVNGSTMVPLRFVSESLGADVHWDSSNYTVNISDKDGAAEGQGISAEELRRQNLAEAREQRIANLQKGEPVVFQSGIVFPVHLDDAISSNGNHQGDRFSATLDSNQAGLPAGTHIDGYVYGVVPMVNNRAGMIEIRFDKAVLPDGASYPIKGYLTRLGEGYVRQEGGRYVAVPGQANNRVIFAGYGSEGGALVGIGSGRSLGNATFSGLFGLSLTGSSDRNPRDVQLQAGTKFGVRLVSGLTIKRGDLH